MPEISITDFFTGSKAFFVAVQNYRSPAIQSLQSPAADAIALKDLLIKQHRFEGPEVTVPTNISPSGWLPNPLIDPDLPQVLAFLSGIDVAENDRVVLYFAGHGIATKFFDAM